MSGSLVFPVDKNCITRAEGNSAWSIGQGEGHDAMPHARLARLRFDDGYATYIIEVLE